MWSKKKSQISGFNANTAVDGTDWRTNENTGNWSASNTPPSAADAGNYFYLPALGYNESGLLNLIGNTGYYWLSSAGPWTGGTAYALYIYRGSVDVNAYAYRYAGYRVEPTFE